MILKNEKGGATVEFAVVLPLLLVIVFGIIEFSLLFYNKAMITNASREAARAGVVFSTNSSGDLHRLTTSDMGAIVNSYCQNYLITFSSSPQPAQTTTSPATPETMVSGVLLTVTVKYHYDYLLLPAFLSNLVGGVDLVANTTMRAE